MKPDGGAGPLSSRDPRIGPSLSVKLALYWMEREVLTVWNGHTVTTVRNRIIRCEATWTDECGEVQRHVTWHKYEDILGAHAYWGVPTKYSYDLEWGDFIAWVTIPPT